jgi:glycine cleavage system aminomethyltransferase T
MGCSDVILWPRAAYRSGGFELRSKAHAEEAGWTKIFEVEFDINRIGFGARDTLRLSFAYVLLK